MTLYASLDETKAELKAGATAETAAEKAKLLRDIRAASRRFDAEFGAHRELFAPVKEARRILVTSERVNSALGLLRVGGSLLDLSGVTAGDTALTVGTDVEGYPDSATPPFPYLRLIDSWEGWYGYCPATNRPLEVVLTGIWGIHRDYANAWPSADTLQANMSSSATSLTVADVDGVDIYGLIPRISAGNLLSITTGGQAEYMEVLSTDTAAQTAAVRRGVNGTTAIAHSSGDAVKVFQVEEPAKRAVARQAGLMYARKGAYVTTEITGLGEVRYPADLLAEVRGIMQEYAYGF